MKPNHSSLAAVLLAGATCFLSGCDERPTHAQAGPVAANAATPKPEPTQERLVARATERWAKIVQADWIQAYEYLSPEQKRSTPLSQYLQNKQNHKYENPRVAEVLRCDGKEGFLRVTSLWTPQHPKVKDVKLEEGQTLTQEVEMFESWRWAGGDWTYLRAQRPDEFFKDHPDFLRAAPENEPVQIAEPKK